MRIPNFQLEIIAAAVRSKENLTVLLSRRILMLLLNKVSFPVLPWQNGVLCLTLLFTASGNETCWKKAGPSKTGTSLHLNIDRSQSCAEHNGSPHIPPLLLTWKGDEPLDRLHICIKVKIGFVGTYIFPQII